MEAVERLFEGHRVRVVGEPGTLRFVAADVCEVLGHGNPSKALGGLDADEKGLTICNTLMGPQEMLTVTLPGLTRLVTRSRKPSARRFDRWLHHEVLPSILSTGAYAVPGVTLFDQVRTALWSFSPVPSAGLNLQGLLVRHHEQLASLLRWQQAWEPRLRRLRKGTVGAVLGDRQPRQAWSTPGCARIHQSVSGYCASCRVRRRAGPLVLIPATPAGQLPLATSVPGTGSPS
jgi:hypothetical protein